MLLRMKTSKFSRQLFFSIILLFLLFAGAFLLYQTQREKTFKIALLDRQLQDYNTALGDALLHMPIEEDTLQSYLQTHSLPSLRLTILDAHGFVLFDNRTKEYPNLSDHRSRREIQDALRTGKGYCLDRRSVTVEGEYFYSATWIPAQELLVRSALPYDEHLPQTLKPDYTFLLYALALMLLLLAVLYGFSRKVAQIVAKAQDRESLALQKEMTQNISHELKTPVAGIRGYLETLHLHPDMPVQTQRQFIGRSLALSRRLAGLVEDLGTLDGAERELQHEKLDVADIIRQVLEDTEEDFSRNGMTVETDIPERIPLQGDGKLLYSLFRNLADNTLRYASAGSRLQVKAWADGARWQFSVSDDGPGVLEESLPHLYERFYRTDKGRSRELGGTGLGLSIVYEAVRLHGGEIWAEPVLPHGLRHRFFLG